MRTLPGSEVVNQDRRNVLSTAATGIAAAGAPSESTRRKSRLLTFAGAWQRPVGPKRRPSRMNPKALAVMQELVRHW